MPTRRLTKKFIDSARTSAPRVEYVDSVARGLALRVTATGQKSWALRYRTAEGALRRLTLGTFPDLSLKDARKRVETERGAIAKGHDPATAKQEARRAAQRTGDSVADLAVEYIEKHAKRHKKSWREDQRILDADVLPHWKARKVADLTRRNVRDLIEGIAGRGAPISANRCLALIRKMLNFAVDREWINANPAARITKPGTERSRERVLTDDEVRLVWAACETERPAMCALLRLRLVTAQRGGELAQLRWEDIDLDTGWLTIPGSVTKNKLPHRVPLSSSALDILRMLPQVEGCEWVFPGRTTLQPLGDARKGGKRVGERVLRAMQKADPAVTMFDFRGHDLRRTASTNMAEAGVSQTDISRVLNHAEGGPRATQVYNRYQYDREKRVALDAWARRLTAILEADKPAAASVVPFARG